MIEENQQGLEKAWLTEDELVNEGKRHGWALNVSRMRSVIWRMYIKRVRKGQQSTLSKVEDDDCGLKIMLVAMTTKVEDERAIQPQCFDQIQKDGTGRGVRRSEHSRSDWMTWTMEWEESVRVQCRLQIRMNVEIRKTCQSSESMYN
jgi:hypothetical protein